MQLLVTFGLVFFATFGSTHRVNFSWIFRHFEFWWFRALWDLVPLTTLEPSHTHTHAHICVIPYSATYRPILARYPIKASLKELCNLSLQVLRIFKKHCCWASETKSPENGEKAMMLFYCSSTLWSWMGEPPQRNTHPNKSVCVKNRNSLYKLSPPLFPLEYAETGRRSLRKLFVETVFVWAGFLFGWVAFRWFEMLSHAQQRMPGITPPQHPLDTASWTGNKRSFESREPHWFLTAMLLTGIAIHLSLLRRYFCKSMPSSWWKVVFTLPICITTRHLYHNALAEVFNSGFVGTPPLESRLTQGRRAPPNLDFWAG